MALTERNDLRSALRLDRPDEPLGVRVQVRAACREFDGLDTSRLQDSSEVFAEQRIAVVDQVPGVAKEPLASSGEVPGDLLHPVPVRLPHDTGDLHRPGLQVDYEQREVAHQPSRSRHLDAEEVRRSDCALVGL
ncbi:MAG: hypothetical protein NTZ61_00150 [Proteobacteria bacterium]|nr:hypothetical protein [Pseudomonadota bacterium]